MDYTLSRKFTANAEPAILLQKRAELLHMLPHVPIGLLKYGIGIAADYRSLNWGTMEFAEAEEDTVLSPGIARYRLERLHENPSLMQTVEPEMLLNASALTTCQYHLVNALFPTDPYVLYIPKKTKRVKPFEIFINGGRKNRLAYVFLYVEEESDVVIVEEIKAMNYLGVIVEVVVQKNSKVTYISNTNYGPHATGMQLHYGRVSEGSTLTWFGITRTETTLKSDVLIDLVEPNATGRIMNIFTGTNSQKLDVNHSIYHHAPETWSHIGAKGVLEDEANTIYRGQIFIAPHATQSYGEERLDTLLLSPNARVATVPNLAINNNQVFCTHATTTTSMTPEKLFCFTSRGIDAETATQAYKESFCTSLLEHEALAQVKEKITELLEKKKSST